MTSRKELKTREYLKKQIAIIYGIDIDKEGVETSEIKELIKRTDKSLIEWRKIINKGLKTMGIRLV